MDRKTVNHSRYRIIFGFLFAYTLFIMLFCAGSSPVIDRMFTDSAVFFTMGRGMNAGKVVYRDLFDHKGWYLYFINYLGTLISESTSIGIWLVEVCFAFTDVLLCFKIARECFVDDIKCIFVSQAMLLLIVNYFTYLGGNTVEYYCLTFQFVSILLFILYERSGKIPHPPIFMLFHGICAGISFGLRANMILVWGAFAVVLITKLFLYHEYKNIIENILYGLAGIIIAWLPPFMYGAFTKSLADMYEQSILFNLMYGSNSMIKNIIHASSSRTGILTLIGGLASCLAICNSKTASLTAKSMFILAWALSILSVSISGYTFGHYYEYTIPLFMPFVLLIVEKLSFLSKKQSKKSRTAICLIVAALTICCNLRLPIKLLLNSESNHYAKEVETVTNLYKGLNGNYRKVLVTGNNALFYNKMGVIPSIKYFYMPLIPYSEYPYAVDSQIESILNEENDIIIVSFQSEELYDKRIIYDDERNEEIYALLDSKYNTLYDDGQFQMWIKNL